MPRSDLIQLLQAERAEAAATLEAIDAAILALNGRPAAPKRVRRMSQNVIARDNALLEYIQNAKAEDGTQRWVTSMEVTDQLGIKRGSIHGMLERLVRNGQLLECKDERPWTWCAP